MSDMNQELKNSNQRNWLKYLIRVMESYDLNHLHITKIQKINLSLNQITHMSDLNENCIWFES